MSVALTFNRIVNERDPFSASCFTKVQQFISKEVIERKVIMSRLDLHGLPKYQIYFTKVNILRV